MNNILSIKSPEEYTIEIAHAVKEMRLNKAWSRQELADRAGINVYSLRRFETTGQINLLSLLALFLVLGKNISHLTEANLPVNIEDIIKQRSRKRGKNYHHE